MCIRDRNPRHAISGLIGDANLAAMVVDPTVPARIDPLNPGAEDGEATDRLHMRLICVDAIAQNGTVGAAAGGTVSDIAAIGISDTQPSADGNQDIDMVQYVQAGNTTLTVDPAELSAALRVAHAANDGSELTVDFFPSDVSGIILHWYLEPADA